MNFACVNSLSCSRSKYGNLEKRAGTSLLRKRLQPNGRKYFDSGDYNMQKEAVKPNEKPSIRTIPGLCYLLLYNVQTLKSEPPIEELPPGLIPDKIPAPIGQHTKLQPRKSTDSPLSRC